MELWQIDMMGGVLPADGTACKVITGIDDHSRFCVIATLVARATARPVYEALLEGLSRHGVPQILTDNGKVVTGRLAIRARPWLAIDTSRGSYPWATPMARRTARSSGCRSPT